MTSAACPRCGTLVPVGSAAVARAVCCVRFDVLVQADGPFRATALTAMDPPAPDPAPLVDLSGGDRLRHLVARANFRQLWRPMTLATSVLLLGALWQQPTRLQLLALAPLSLVAVVLALLGAFSLTAREEVWLTDGVLCRRRWLLGLPRTRRIPVADIRAWTVIGRGRHDTGAKLRLDLADGDALFLFAGLDQDDADIRWAATHLQSGIRWSQATGA